MVERDVGTAFVHKYYSTFSRDPVELGAMYSKGSIFAHASVGRNLDFVEGREDITATLAEISKSEGNTDCKFTLHNVDCVPSMNGSIMLLVQGVMLTRETTREFAHTFLLGRNSNNTFYIHNDIMRICEHDDEDYEEEEEEEEVQEQPAPALPTVEEVTGETFEEPAAPKQPTPVTKPQPAAKVEKPKKVVEEQSKAKEEPKDDTPKAPPSSWAALVGSTSQPVGTSNTVRITGGALAQQQPKKKAKGEESRKGGKGGDKPKRSEKGGKGDSKGDDKKERKPRDANYNFYSLYLSKLPEGFKEEDVREVFGKFGEIKGMKYQDSQTMNAGGKRCFVDYGSKESMEAALKDEIKWNGAVLNVQERKSPMQRKEEKGSGSKGGRKEKPKGDKKN